MNLPPVPSISGRVSIDSHVDIYRNNDLTYTWVLMDECEQVVVSGTSTTVSDALNQAHSHCDCAPTPAIRR